MTVEPVWPLKVLLGYGLLPKDTNRMNVPGCDGRDKAVIRSLSRLKFKNHLRGMLEFRLWCSSWISSRASSKLWLCRDFLLLNLLLLLPLLPPRGPTPSRELSRESRREMSHSWHTGGTERQRRKQCVGLLCWIVVIRFICSSIVFIGGSQISHKD